MENQEVNLINNCLIIPTYLDALMEEISDLLSDNGSLEISDLTNKYWLPITFLKSTIEARMHQLPTGCCLESGILVTSTFAERQMSKVRGILCATTRPASINSLSQKFKFDEFKLKSLID